MPLYTSSASLPVPASGQYFFPLSLQSQSTAVTLGNGTLRLAPWLVTRPLALSKIGTEVTVIGDVGSKLRLGIYADNGNAYPGSLVVDAGQIAGDSATAQELTISQTLAPGVYWIGGAVQAVTTTQPTVRVLNVDWDPALAIPMGTTLASVTNVTGAGFSQASVTGALPSTFTSTVTPTGNVPRLLMKVA